MPMLDWNGRHAQSLHALAERVLEATSARMHARTVAP
jgi:hypothetical protein